jgi:HSP20 family molecular chaperone IbpA
MSFFDNDEFEDVFREFLGEGNTRRYRREVSSEEEDRMIDFIEGEEYSYLILEVPGYEEDDVKVDIKGKVLEVQIKKRDIDGIREYLAQKLASGLRYNKTLPESVSTKGFDWSLKNGILEIKFGRKE